MVDIFLDLLVWSLVSTLKNTELLLNQNDGFNISKFVQM